jgi:hypothetical protein
MEQKKVMTYRGRPVDEMTREELIEVLEKMHQYYEERLAMAETSISFFRQSRGL